ncbi:hypothetical protein [Vannielia litorea]|uniref:hypothetical protein n=1 Tax=Vannielia litorea TaxID=1217970 RepID=UPI001C94146D|nr:hypothetical protein [Vannielia litorea]MBY6047118.1 hypothetical protein [Vannielia litorea]MBY6074532.1 hypothetical protein [Vannielia litorea]
MKRSSRVGLFVVLGLATLGAGFGRYLSYVLNPESQSSGTPPPPINTAVRASFQIPVSHPKLRNPSPFKYVGKEMSFDHVFIKDAYKTVPNAEACLAKVEGSDTTLNLLDLKWASLRSDEEVRLCLFYIADILGSSERTEAWFRAQEMHVHITTVPGNSEPPMAHTILRATFPENVPQSCSLYDMFVDPIFNPSRWIWNIRQNASGVRVVYARDGAIRDVGIERGSCLN